MNNDNKRLGIFIVVTALIILIGMLLYTYYFKKKNEAPIDSSATSTAAAVIADDKLMLETKNNQPQKVYTFDPQAEKNREYNAEDLRKIALSFVERFGSYSNESQYSNLEDLKIFMTDKMKTWADNYAAQLKKQNANNNSYYGITTVSISGEVKSFDNKQGTAQIIVTTKRQESVADNSASPAFDQKITIDFVKVDKDWKVDGAFWQDK